jgi:hypothetical protein
VPQSDNPGTNAAGAIARRQMAARTVNVEPWEPLPGRVKRQCPKCRYRFAVAVEVAMAEAAPLCPHCVRSRR